MYWQKNAEKTLNNLNPGDFLHLQLASSFSLSNSPIWMDSSTTKQCKMLEDVVGGPEVGKGIILLIGVFLDFNNFVLAVDFFLLLKEIFFT